MQTSADEAANDRWSPAGAEPARQRRAGVQPRPAADRAGPADPQPTADLPPGEWAALQRGDWSSVAEGGDPAGPSQVPPAPGGPPDEPAGTRQWSPVGITGFSATVDDRDDAVRAAEQPVERQLLGLPVGALLGLLVVAALGATIAVVAVRADAPAAGPARPPAGGGPGAGGGRPPAAERTATAPVDNRTDATFDLLTGTSAVDVRIADLPGELYRMSTPAGSSVLPRPQDDGDLVRLHLVPSGDTGAGAVQVLLSSAVRWTVRLTGGAAEYRVDLSAGRVARVDFVGGATRIDLRLPEPQGTLRVRMTGGVNRFAVRGGGDAPMRVRIGSGATSVTFGDRLRRGVAPDTTFTPHGWSDARDRIDLDAVAGVGTLTVRS